MFYHTRPMKFVTYGKVYPPPREYYETEEKHDIDFLRMYDWLGHHCGFSPQIWLSRSQQRLTGYYRRNESKDDWVLFGFEHIIGFPVDYAKWEFLMCEIMNPKPNIAKMINEIKTDIIAEGDNKDHHYDYLFEYDTLGENDWLKKYLFVEHDQVVLPSLNLKSAKKIVCRNERQCKQLRRMGFIDDRIEIRNAGKQKGKWSV